MPRGFGTLFEGCEVIADLLDKSGVGLGYVYAVKTRLDDFGSVACAECGVVSLLGRLYALCLGCGEVEYVK